MKKKALLIIAILAVMASSFSCTKKNAIHKVALIGMDGLDWRIVREMSARGELPNIKKFLDGGVVSEMKTLEPILSPAIWTTIATGVPPEEHGITWFLVKDANGQMIPVTSQQRRVPAIWNIVSDFGDSVDVLGWWATWPAEKVKGYIVSDHMGYHIFNIQSDKVETDVGNTYPEDLGKDLNKDRVDPFSLTLKDIRRYMKITDREYNISIDMKQLCERPEYKDCLYCKGEDKIPFCHLNPLHHFMRALATLNTFYKISLDMLGKKQPDLFMVYFEWPDVVSHQYIKFMAPQQSFISADQFAKYSDTIRQTYMRQDEVLGEIIKKLDPNTDVLIMSDHGFKIGDERRGAQDITEVATAHLDHHSPAFLAMMGPDFRKGGKKIDANVADITPTMLALMGLPIAEYIKGKVLSDAIDPAFLQKHPIQRVKAYKQEDNQGKQVTQATGGSNIDPQIKEHLKALGYIGNVDDSGLEMNRVDLLIKNKQYAEAEDAMKKVLAENSQNLKTITMLGDLYLVEHKYDLAVQTFSMVDKVDFTKLPPDAKKVFGKINPDWGLALVGMGKFAEAQAKCDQAVKDDPKNYLGQFCLGRIDEAQKNNEEALKHYLEAIKINPKNAEAFNNVGNCYQREKQYDKAIEYYKKAAAANPQNFECHHNAAMAYQRMGNLTEAEKEMRKALEINPNLGPSWNELGNILMKQSKFADAARAYTEFIKLRPSDPGPLIQLARAQMYANNNQAAIAALRQARQMNPAMVDNKVSSDPAFMGLNPQELQ